jgi:DNA-binding NtrC family response regulator
VLEEVGELPRPTQVRLLQALEQVLPGAPVGPADVRIIATTRRDLGEQVASGRFLKELFLRLNVLELSIPPLRMRKNDLAALAGYFLAKLNAGRTAAPGFSSRAWTALSEYPFPGNVKELGAALGHAFLSSNGSEIDLDDLPREIGGTGLAAT